MVMVCLNPIPISLRERRFDIMNYSIIGAGNVGSALARLFAHKNIAIAVPFPAHKEVAKKFKKWSGKIVVDVTNALDVDPKKLKGRLSSEIVSKAFAGARLVKAFNHLPIEQLGTNPDRKGQRQVVFVSSNDADASSTVAALASRLGFAPIELGRLDKGGVPLHAIEGKPGGLLSQNLAKLVGGKHE
jgi:hypothetical protein